MTSHHDPSIQIVPPILGTKADPNPRFLDLTMEVELFLNHDEYDKEVTEAERAQYNFWQVAESVCDQLHRMIQFNEVQDWPGGALTVAATTLLIADVALQQWRREEYGQCLVTSEVARRGEAELTKLLKG